MDKVECIVVGAGPAGSACAIELARRGVETVVLERGQLVGEKNVASFALFGSVLSTIIPGYENEAPLERLCRDLGFVFLRGDDFFEFHGRLSNIDKKEKVHTAYRSKFDAWFASKAEEAGATILRGVCVTGLLKENGRVVGVKVGDEEMLADVVVGADGFHSVVSRESGLYVDDTSRCLLGIKEVHDLPPEVIEERFNLLPGEGVAWDGFGYPADSGGAFSMYTLNDSVAVVLLVPMDAIREGKNVRECMEELKTHPYIHAHIKGSKLREYESHIIADGGRLRLNQLYTDGVLLCGDAGSTVNEMYTGVPSCMLSGVKAAETVAYAKQQRRYDAETLAKYKEFLYTTGLPRVMFNARHLSDFMAKSGMKNMGTFADKLFDFLEDASLEDFNYLGPEPYPVARKTYNAFVEPFIQKKWLKPPMELFIGAIDKLAGWNKKRKIRRAE
jgi:electron transfer flavoprotein-quinone oxidoreductase